jgi:WD40 repeat protein
MALPGEVWSVAIGPQGHHVLAAGGGMVKDGKIQPGGDYGVRMWETETGRLDRVFKGHTERVLSVAFGPLGGHHFLSGGWDGVMRYYAIRNSEEVRQFKGHRGGILSVAFSHDAVHALSGGFDQTIRLWEVATGEQVRVLEGHTARVTGVAFLSGDRQAVSVSLDRTMRLWDLDTGKEVRSFPHPTGVGCVAVGPGPHVLTGSGWVVNEVGVPQPAGFDSSVRLWDLSSGEQLARSADQGGAITSVAVAPDGHTALVGALDSSVRLLKVPD